MQFTSEEMVKSVDNDEEQMMLPLIYSHVYDEVEINTAVPWSELEPRTQVLARKVVDYYRMKASVHVDSHISIRSINIESDDEDEGMVFYLIATVEPLGDNDIDYDELFADPEDDVSEL